MRRMAFLFPGQGSQYVGMGKQLHDGFKAAKLVFEEADDCLDMNLSKLIFEGNPEELTRTENTQPALLAVSVAAFRVYMEEIGVAPHFLAGHSLGEFSALTCAGVIDLSDALRIVRQRGRFMQQAAAEGSGTMCAIMGLGFEVIDEACRLASNAGLTVVISNYNSPEQTVISGDNAAVRIVAERLEEKGARIAYLKVSAAFHSPLMASAAVRLEEELRKYRYRAFQWPVISNVSGLPYSDPLEVISNLSEQMTSPVRWEKSMRKLADLGMTAAIEMGPQKVLSQLMKANIREIQCLSLETMDSVGLIKKELEHEIRNTRGKHAINQIIARCLVAAVSTRNANWDNEQYRTGVIEPYHVLQGIQDRLDEQDRGPDIGEAEEALNLLKRIWDTKRVSITEQTERFRDIVKGTDMEGILVFPDGDRSLAANE